MGPDEVSWKVHSPNVACAHMCVNFEDSEYVKATLDYIDSDEAKSKQTHRSNKTVEPRKNIERARLYEWCILMFKNDVSNRKYFVVDGYNMIKELKTKLKQPGKVKMSDELEECINSMFKRSDTVNIEENDVMNDVANDGETVERIHDDYNFNSTNIIDNSGQRGNSTATNNPQTVVNKLGLGNIFHLGHAKMVEMKIPQVRERKQNRMKRSQDFFLSVHEMVMKGEENITIELNHNDNTMIPRPWFRETYRATIN